MTGEFDEMMSKAFDLTELQAPGDMTEAMPSSVVVLGAGFQEIPIDGERVVANIAELHLGIVPTAKGAEDFPRLMISITPEQALSLISHLAAALGMEPPPPEELHGSRQEEG